MKAKAQAREARMECKEPIPVETLDDIELAIAKLCDSFIVCDVRVYKIDDQLIIKVGGYPIKSELPQVRLAVTKEEVLMLAEQQPDLED